MLLYFIQFLLSMKFPFCFPSFSSVFFPFFSLFFFFLQVTFETGTKYVKRYEVDALIDTEMGFQALPTLSSFTHRVLVHKVFQWDL